MQVTAQQQTQNNEGLLSSITLDTIIPFSLGNARTKRNAKKFNELKSSIQNQGVIQPILLRPSPEVDGLYELIAGNGRHQAAVELGLEDIPAMIRPMDDKAALEAHIAENTNREDLGLVDEARVAGKWYAFFEGDKKAAASRLGWTVKKLSERLELLRCAEPLLEAIEEGKIKPAHAMILASFPEKRQVATLKTIIDENWTVQYLAERAGKAQRYLSTAKFDISTTCAGCEHNSEAQSGLFDIDSRAKCSNMACFKKHTAAWLEKQKTEAEEEHGKVLLLVDVTAENRNAIDATVLGDQQVAEGCTGCESNVVLMDDRYGREGNLYKNQCLDKVCFNKCLKAHQNQNQKPETEPVSSNEQQVSPNPSSTENTSTQAVKPKKPVQKINKKIIEQSRTALRKVGADTMMNDPTFKQGVMLSLLCQRSGYKPKLEGLQEVRSRNFKETVVSCIGLDPMQLQGEIMAAVEYLVRDATNNDSQSDYQFIDLMLSAFSKHEKHKDIATEAWLPTEEILTNYTKEQLTKLCEDSGFATFYDSAHKPDAFKVLSGKGKKEFVKGILSFDFDWSAFAPEAGYLDQIK